MLSIVIDAVIAIAGAIVTIVYSVPSRAVWPIELPLGRFRYVELRESSANKRSRGSRVADK